MALWILCGPRVYSFWLVSVASYLWWTRRLWRICAEYKIWKPGLNSTIKLIDITVHLSQQETLMAVSLVSRFPRTKTTKGHHSLKTLCWHLKKTWQFILSSCYPMWTSRKDISTLSRIQQFEILPLIRKCPVIHGELNTVYWDRLLVTEWEVEQIGY